MVGNKTNQTNKMNFKLVIMGDNGVGKSTFIRRHMTGEFEKNYKPTSGVAMNLLSFFTTKTKGTVDFNIWDCAGTDNIDTQQHAYFAQADAAILMFDRTNVQSYQNVINWYNAFRSICPNAPVVIVGNKVDIRNTTVKSRHITIHRTLNLKYYDVSAKSNCNFEKPFLYLARILLNIPNLQFIGEPPTNNYISS